jgi:hypothetical protein
VELINQFNRFSVWIGSEIVTCVNLRRRIALLKLFISAAWCAYGYRDYESTFMITQSLNQFAVERLAETWKGLDDETKQKWETLQKFTSVRSNYKNYRHHMKKMFQTSKSHQNVLPYFGLFLRDLTAIEETSSVDKTGAVNFHKMRLVAAVIEDVQRAQKSIFNFEKDIALVSYLMLGTKQLDEDTMDAESRKREPKSDFKSPKLEALLSNIFKPKLTGEVKVVSKNPIFGLSAKK